MGERYMGAAWGDLASTGGPNGVSCLPNLLKGWLCKGHKKYKHNTTIK